jgi:hypothetical protein
LGEGGLFCFFLKKINGMKCTKDKNIKYYWVWYGFNMYMKKMKRTKMDKGELRALRRREGERWGEVGEEGKA